MNEYMYVAECLEYKRTLKTTKDFIIFLTITLFIVDIIYYITTYSYINSVEKEEKEVDYIKDVENPN